MNVDHTLPNVPIIGNIRSRSVWIGRRLVAGGETGKSDRLGVTVTQIDDNKHQWKTISVLTSFCLVLCYWYLNRYWSCLMKRLLLQVRYKKELQKSFR